VAAKGATVAIFIADLSSQTAVRKLASEVLARYSTIGTLLRIVMFDWLS